MNINYLSKRILNFALDLIFPRHCALCGRVILGTRCLPLCIKCDQKPLAKKTVCDDSFVFDYAAAFVKYEGKARDAMIKYKFKSIKYYLEAYAHLIDKGISDNADFKDAIMCPVPLSKGRKRPYNQTALIAERLSEMWDIEYIPDLMYKCCEVGQLGKMNLAERKFYIKDAIDVNPWYDIYGKNIVVIDDIYTSGTTANECASLLKMYGAAGVYVLCACYD